MNQAQLKETIEKYGPVRQPVRETTIKILRSDNLRHLFCCWASALPHYLPYQCLLFEAEGFKVMKFQVGIQRVFQKFAYSSRSTHCHDETKRPGQIQPRACPSMSFGKWYCYRECVLRFGQMKRNEKWRNGKKTSRLIRTLCNDYLFLPLCLLPPRILLRLLSQRVPLSPQILQLP